MPLGDEPWGTFKIGFDTSSLSAAPVNTHPEAPVLDPKTGRHLIDADGNFESQDAVYHEVVMRLRVMAGQLASTPNNGHTLNRITYIAPGGKHETEVRDRIRLALKPMVDRGVLRIDSIEVDVPHRGLTQTRVRTTNLLTNKPVRPAYVPQLAA